jgi:hypothetical protein
MKTVAVDYRLNATESAGADDYRALAGEVLKRLATEGLRQWHARAR